MKSLVRVGILGAGQLARMLVEASDRAGVQPFIFANKPTDCAVQVADQVIYNDGSLETLSHFCKQVDVLTIENEFIDLNWLVPALGSVPLFPSVDCLRLIQDKLQQKRNLHSRGLACLDFEPVSSKEDLGRAIKRFGENLVLKKARFGYDGKGTFIFNRKKHLQIDEFWHTHGDFEGYAEPFCPFDKELAVIVARSRSGEVVHYPVVETNQEGGICRWAVAPAEIEPPVAASAIKLARNVIKSFDGVGVFGVEMFLLPDGRVVVNEIAPRVHNSGHLTMDGCKGGQFEMHLRAVTGKSLIGGKSSSSELLEEKLLWPAMAMVNILGRKKMIDSEGPEFKMKTEARSKNVWIHWYGKTGEALGRKLGHVNAADDSVNGALKKALEARERILT